MFNHAVAGHPTMSPETTNPPLRAFGRLRRAGADRQLGAVSLILSGVSRTK
jgi:hypothetical protein